MGKYVKGKGDTKDIGEVKSFKKVRGVKVTAARKVHILDGDSKGGGHRYGTGKSGKTEFPQDWDDNKVIANIENVISDKNSKIVVEESGIFQIFGTKEGIDIKVVMDPKTEIVITAFPTNTPINP